jgi:hypothetical protein
MPYQHIGFVDSCFRRNDSVKRDDGMERNDSGMEGNEIVSMRDN